MCLILKFQTSLNDTTIFTWKGILDTHLTNYIHLEADSEIRSHLKYTRQLYEYTKNSFLLCTEYKKI